MGKKHTRFSDHIEEESFREQRGREIELGFKHPYGKLASQAHCLPPKLINLPSPAHNPSHLRPPLDLLQPLRSTKMVPPRNLSPQRRHPPLSPSHHSLEPSSQRSNL